MISLSDKRFLLQLARQTLNLYLRNGDMPDVQTKSPTLQEPRATFVTLRERTSGELRGCRGEIHARHPLIESVALMTIASATDDPRFPPVKVDEIPGLHLEINALSPLVPIEPQDIEVGRHGLMIVLKKHAGLLLPEVATRYRWDTQTFLKAVCRKARLPENAWMDPDVKLFGFEAEVWGEE